MSPMNHRLLRPRRRAAGSQYLLTQDGERLLTEAGEELMTDDGAVHPEALDWASRVTANGGTVSSTTLAAVSAFCAAIQAAGIRDRFYRLNLFCGSDLSAALVPLYRSPSLAGSPTGNTIDENNGPFVSGDYAEIGSSGGLNPGSSNSTKYLNTGLTPDGLDTVATGHVSAWNAAFTTPGAGNFRSMISVFGATTATQIYAIQSGGGNFNRYGYWGTSTPVQGESFTSTTPAGHLVMTRESASNARFYIDGVQSGGTQSFSVTPGALAQPWYVFANNNNGLTQRHWQAILRSYSIGRSLTGAQAATFYTAIQSFMQAMGRE